MSFATCRSALDGIQPRYTHTPPGFTSGSMSAVLRPRSAARNAAAYPPGPPPTTATCTVIIVGQEGQEGKDAPEHRDRSFSRPAGPAFPAFPACFARESSLAGEREQERLFERLDDPSQEADTVGAVDHTVVVGQRQRQHQPRHEGPILVDRLHLRARDAEDGNLGRVHDR